MEIARGPSRGDNAINTWYVTVRITRVKEEVIQYCNYRSVKYRSFIHTEFINRVNDLLLVSSQSKSSVRRIRAHQTDLGDF